MIEKKRRAGRDRPVVRWHGGKWILAPRIIEHFPPHFSYVEPYGGGASVLIRKRRCVSEIYNDLDQTIVNVFRVLRDPTTAAQLIRLLELTPYSRVEFEAAYEPCDDPVEAARRTIVRSYQGYGSDGTTGTYRTGFRANARMGEATPAQEWANYPMALRHTIDRVKDVMIESTDALPLISKNDAPNTLFYIDPPYLPATRSTGNRRRGAGYHVYNHEMEVEDHEHLLALLVALEGMVVLSGYPSDLYDAALAGWQRVEMDAFADGARPRTEVLWINPACQEANCRQKTHHGPLFA